MRAIPYDAPMGFEPITLGALAVATAAQAAGSLLSSNASRSAAKATRAEGTANKAVLDQQADLTLETGRTNATRMQRDATNRLGLTYLDAAKGNLVHDGSVATREQSVASRLITEINDAAAQSMQQAQELRTKGNMEEWESRLRADALKKQATGTLLTGIGSLATNISRF